MVFLAFVYFFDIWFWVSNSAFIHTGAGSFSDWSFMCGLRNSFDITSTLSPSFLLR
jgi:hypothetical protein